MTVHINQHFAVMDQNHRGEEERRNDVGGFVMHIDIPINLLFFLWPIESFCAICARQMMVTYLVWLLSQILGI